MMESTESWTATQLPPGFRFHPTDEELVVHYLKKRAASTPLPVPIIAEVDIYKFDPWELPAKATFGEEEWYFFSPRDRKYPNGVRPNRAATSGYWKATGTDKPVLSSGGATQIMVGVKKALVFYGGRPPKGIKTSWIMHEYRLADKKVISPKPPPYNMANKKGSLRLDDWVLCRIYKKSNSQRAVEHDMVESSRIPASTGLDIGKQNPNVHEVVEGSILHSALLQNDEDKLLEALGEQMKNDDLIDMNINGGCVSSSMPQLPNLVAFTLDTHPSDLHTVKYHGADEEGSFGKTDESNNPFATLLNYQLPQAAHPSLQYHQTYHHQQHTSSAINWYI